jgi:DNA modification methylase
VRDRFTVDYEYVFFFAAEKSYYFKQSEIIEPYSEQSDPYEEYNGQATKDYGAAMAQNPSETKKRILEGMAERGGRNKRCVWSITTKPFSEAHFAVFPPNLLEPMIKAGCPPDGVVFDPFIGSGTVGIVAEKFNRKWLGIELNAEFIELAEKRLKKETTQRYLEGIFDD